MSTISKVNRHDACRQPITNLLHHPEAGDDVVQLEKSIPTRGRGRSSWPCVYFETKSEISQALEEEGDKDLLYESGFDSGKVVRSSSSSEAANAESNLRNRLYDLEEFEMSYHYRRRLTGEALFSFQSQSVRWAIVVLFLVELAFFASVLML